ncbi:YdeI/OmpD-associated family protein [Celeribacter neptunius]|uniref:Uncharacterized conserved protein YdeI, YjbR/CyaY-like superfamily, DUF1801 family n=1 Tax=Celeribacter neptunius TaxID=588602 RepID=A0A1I3TPK7_9RHOB|nr:YdeI/OmpD-associated family protein [Celeribacter neptunius]SFJ73148.1 Uncharacterized conserved protein YdeI, YjbR/CyaY-like superfamily, DUF1801 family [Celeribacter neptunius]
MVMITEIEEFFNLGCGRCKRFATPECSVQLWLSGLLALRRICREAGLEEHVKWGHPCYMHAGRNIALIGAFRGNFRLSFMNAALLKDPENVLRRQGANTAHPDMLCFEEAGKVDEMAPVIRAYLKEAMSYAERGIRPDATPREVALPDELIEALDADPELAEAFWTLTPGRRKSYAINLNAAKTSATRCARIARFRDKILAGKGATER